MNYKKIIFWSLPLGLLVGRAAQAFCPVCTVAVGVGLGLSRWLGVDDYIIGLWIGALTVSLIFWTSDTWPAKWRFGGYKWAIAAMYIVLIIAPLPFLHWTGRLLPLLAFLGLDKLMTGIITGAAVFWCAGAWYEFLKARHHGKPYFPYQKVITPISLLLLLSLAFYWWVL